MDISAQIQIQFLSTRPKCTFSCLTRITPESPAVIVLQACKSICAKTPSFKSHKASQQPLYRRCSASKQAENHAEIDSDIEAFILYSDEEIPIYQLPATDREDEERFCD